MLVSLGYALHRQFSPRFSFIICLRFRLLQERLKFLLKLFSVYFGQYDLNDIKDIRQNLPRCPRKALGTC